jgi:hypothetical protein
MSATRDATPTPYLQTEFAESQAQFSPDGRWVAYVSNDSDPTEVYVQAFPPSGKRMQISSSGGFRPRWREDGKELFFLTPRNILMAVDVNGSTVNFQKGVPKELFPTRIRPFADHFAYDVSNSGQTFFMAALPPPTEADLVQPLNVVLNFTSTLKKK